MFKSEIKTWVRICIFNLMIVAVLGSLMRFKIAFEFVTFSFAFCSFWLDIFYLDDTHSQ
jgi:hypothetical protein